MANRVKPAAFIFDCDGTLLDSMGSWLTVQPKLLATYGVKTTQEDFARFEHLSIEDECRAYHETWGVGESGEDVFARLWDLMKHEYQEVVTERPGALAFVREAAAAGIPMAIATSTSLDLVSIGLGRLGFAPYFPDIVTTEDAGRSKEHPDVYNLALERLRERYCLGEVDHGSVWIFEDAVFGLKSSGEAGYRRVGIYDPHGRAEREAVRSLSDIFADSYGDFTLDDILSFGDGR